ncbi:hypothetical protein J1N35_012927 [Gossypium stocksii]|uniref:Anaphase-promoting complex subunit 4 WD40 domain-containing protein n=1 Tax=Gossypium stocksii TaxID=47602 RepID=A0A9D4A8C4_9ROSI|nr:hypothetical protein J1N35_012927 [Gossypium stocksii]
MEIVARDGGNALSGPRPMEWSTVPYAPQGPDRNTSSLESPTMLLTGHQSATYAMKSNPARTIIASGPHDRNFSLKYPWGCKDFMTRIETGKQIKKMAEHSSFVNSCCPSQRGPPLVVSSSDDGTAKLWDMHQRGAIQTFPDKYQITAVSFSDTSDKIFTGGIDNNVKVWDLRKGEVSMTLQGHQDMIKMVPIFSLMVWIANSAYGICALTHHRIVRCMKLFEGHQHNFEKNLLKCGWSPDGSKVTAGSSDRMVYIWDTTSRRILFKLPGHTGSVNETIFHPNEPIVGSCRSDKQIYLGEI